MKLSIIIPIYNNENTLGRCLESVLLQNIDDCEILLIDDGSIDNSGIIADEYACNNNMVVAFHKPNGGLSDARNYGLDRAKGDYVTFMDSDDELAPNSLQPIIDMLDRHPEYDIVEYSVLQNAGSSDECLLRLDNRVYNSALDWLSSNGCSHCWMCNKVFKSKLFATLRFPLHLKIEDMRMINELLTLNPVMVTTSHGTYKYYRNESGIMASMSNLTALARAQMDIVHKHRINTRERRWHRLYMDMYDIQLYVYIHTGNILIPRQWVVPSFHRGITGFIKSVTLNLLGLKLSCKMFMLFHKLVRQ